MKQHCQGLTLLELLLTVAVASTLATLATPPVIDWVYRQQSQSYARHITRLIQYARLHAIERQVPVIICASPTHTHCTHNWNQGTLVFLDNNKNRELDEKDTLLIQHPPIAPDGEVTWRAAFGRPYFQALPNGRVSYTGSFLYCPPNGDERYAISVIVNSAGRPRWSRDSNGDGIAEGSSGKPLSCKN